MLKRGSPVVSSPTRCCAGCCGGEQDVDFVKQRPCCRAGGRGVLAFFGELAGRHRKLGGLIAWPMLEGSSKDLAHIFFFLFLVCPRGARSDPQNRGRPSKILGCRSGRRAAVMGHRPFRARRFSPTSKTRGVRRLLSAALKAPGVAHLLFFLGRRSSSRAQRYSPTRIFCGLRRRVHSSVPILFNLSLTSLITACQQCRQQRGGATVGRQGARGARPPPPPPGPPAAERPLRPKQPDRVRAKGAKCFDAGDGQAPPPPRPETRLVGPGRMPAI